MNVGRYALPAAIPPIPRSRGPRTSRRYRDRGAPYCRGEEPSSCAPRLANPWCARRVKPQECARLAAKVSPHAGDRRPPRPSPSVRDPKSRRKGRVAGRGTRSGRGNRATATWRSGADGGTRSAHVRRRPGARKGCARDHARFAETPAPTLWDATFESVPKRRGDLGDGKRPTRSFRAGGARGVG